MGDGLTKKKITNGADGLGLHVDVPQLEAHVVARQYVPPVAV